MKAAKIQQHPSFALMTRTDIQKVCYMQMPLWLFSDPRYAEMSLDAKVAYTFLLNRFQLSRRNGWVNKYGEVFVIFPRKELAAELRICEQRVTAAFRKLVELNLIWEKRCGRGDANQVYLANVEPVDDPAYASTPIPPEADCDSRTADSEVLAPRDTTVSAQEPQDMSGKNLKNCGYRTADSAAAEQQKLRPSNIEKRNIDLSYPEVSQPVSAGGTDGRADDEEELMGILEACELYAFSPEVARVFENAIERLFYLDSFQVGGATLPQRRVRAKLRLLDGMILRDAERKLRSNLDRTVKNSTAYTMATIFNCITECESDLMVDPDLNGIGTSPGGGW